MASLWGWVSRKRVTPRKRGKGDWKPNKQQGGEMRILFRLSARPYKHLQVNNSLKQGKKEHMSPPKPTLGWRQGRRDSLTVMIQ